MEMDKTLHVFLASIYKLNSYLLVLIYSFLKSYLILHFLKFSIFLRVNCKIHPQHLRLLGFYILKFENWDFTPQSLLLLAK